MSQRLLALRRGARRASVLTAAAASLLLASGSAAVVRADPILVSDDRFVLAYATLGEGGAIMESRGPTVSFERFDATVSASRASGGSTATSTAFQRSVVSPTRFTGAGALESVAAATGTWIGASANSAFAIAFELDVPYRYTFVGDFQRGGTGFTEFEVAFRGEGGLGEGQEFGTSGVLPTGRHEFYISVLTEAFPGEFGVERAMGSYTVDLSLQPVPEPGSLALLATGLAGVIARTRRSRRRV